MSSVCGPGCGGGGGGGNVRHQLSEVKSPSEGPGRNPLVDPDVMISRKEAQRVSPLPLHRVSSLTRWEALSGWIP